MYLQRFAQYLSWLANESEGKISPPSSLIDDDIEQGKSSDAGSDGEIVNRVNIQGEQESTLYRLVEALPYICSYLCLSLGV